MKIRLLLFIAFLLMAISAQPQEKTFDLYLLIGQSNMAGRGTVEAQDTVNHPNIYTLNKKNEWVPAKDPIHFDKEIAGVGLGRTFGIEMAKANPDKVIGLVPCAVGGSPIDSWTKGGYYEETNSHPWDDMEKRLKIALQKGELKGILWHQGESDSNPEKCGEYKEKLESLIIRIRKLAENYEVPFIAGELGRFFIKENKKEYPSLKICPAEMVVASTKELMKNDKNAAFVSSVGLHDKGDNTHFNSKSYRKLGKRYAKKMVELQKKQN